MAASNFSAQASPVMAAAKTKADGIAKAVKSGKDFSAAVTAAVADATASTQTGVSGSSVTGDYADWLKDASRKTGDVTVVESADTGYYVVEFVGRSDNHYQLAEARHILVKAVASSDGTYTDAAKATAKTTAQKYYDEWKAGAATEDSFAALATKYSEDTGSASNGGLYDSIYKGEMVTEFNDFVFAAGRQKGDTALVYGETSDYCGYHGPVRAGLLLCPHQVRLYPRGQAHRQPQAHRRAARAGVEIRAGRPRGRRVHVRSFIVEGSPAVNRSSSALVCTAIRAVHIF